MGLTKQYLRYTATSQFGVVGSPRANIVYLKMRNTTSRYVAVSACENVNVWDTRTSEKVLLLQGDKNEVSCMSARPNQDQIAVGYSNGAIKIFSLITGEVAVTFDGHRSAVSCLSYDKEGMRLASGSHDTDIVVWDLVSESGLYRLKGHKGIVTHCCFTEQANMLITSSKDTYIKWWDLETQHCFKTMTGHRAEVWCFVLTPDEGKLISGSSDSQLRVWEVKFNLDKTNEMEPTEKMRKENENSDSEEDDIDGRQVVCTKLGSISRKSHHRVVGLNITQDGKFLLCHGNEKTVEVFQVLTETEIDAKMKKKLKALKKKKNNEDNGENLQVEKTIEDEIQPRGIYTCAGKISSLVSIKSSQGFHIATLLTNNQIEVIQAKSVSGKVELTMLKKLWNMGHRSETKSMCFTEDGMALLTTASETVKLWNRNSRQCVHTLKALHTKQCLVAPGDIYALLATQEGAIEVHNIASGTRLENIEAHSASISSLVLQPSQRGLVSGGEDKVLKFWDFDLVKEDNSTMRLTLKHSRSLQLDEEILAIDFTPNGKLIAVSLLDSSVKIFFTDTLKFFLSLYGHSLPANCISISTDGSLIITGSADRNVKIWGLDFGDCHKSLFAHDDDVTCVKFIPDTHLFFSAGKDGFIKQWDADKFILVQIMQSHMGAVLCLSVSRDGDHVASSGRDRSLRLWERTPEIVVPEEEREQEREEEEEKNFVKNQQSSVRGEPESEEIGRASKTTSGSVRSTERIMEALELYDEEIEKEKDHILSHKDVQTPYVSKHPILMAQGNIPVLFYVLEVIKKIKSSELEESLLVLPFSYVPNLLNVLNKLVDKGRDVELVCRCVFFLLRIHHGQITSNHMLVDILDQLRTSTRKQVKVLRDTIGFNLAALKQLKSDLETAGDPDFFSDATQRMKAKNKKKRKREQMTRALRTM